MCDGLGPPQPPTLSGTGNEYQSKKCSDAHGWGGRMTHSIRGLTCGWQVKLCDHGAINIAPCV